jgi:ribonuclease HI
MVPDRMRHRNADSLPSRAKFDFALWMEIRCTNNQAEYETIQKAMELIL